MIDIFQMCNKAGINWLILSFLPPAGSGRFRDRKTKKSPAKRVAGLLRIRDSAAMAKQAAGQSAISCSTGVYASPKASATAR